MSQPYEHEWHRFNEQFHETPEERNERQREKRLLTIVEEIASEYRRQCFVEGYDDEHDDQHTDGSLALAACAYALPENVTQFMDANDIKLWPFKGDPKFKNRRYDLIRAAALIVAEIARLDRAT